MEQLESRYFNLSLVALLIAFAVPAHAVDELTARDETLQAQESNEQDQQSEPSWWSVPAVSARSALDSISIHGFAGEAYKQSFENPYVGGDEGGTWDSLSAGLTVEAHPIEGFRVFSQLSTGSGEGEEEESSVQFDRAFGEVIVSESFKIRGGRVSHPIGLYSEVFDIGTLRPFFDLPQGAYGPSGISGESYEGFGFTGFISLKGWEISYDVYGGELDLEIVEAFRTFDCEGSAEGCEEEGEGIDDVLGGRVLLSTPIDGLTVGASGYFTIRSHGDPTAAWGFQARYENDDVELNSEFYHFRDPLDPHSLDTAYIEGTCRAFNRVSDAGPLKNLELVGRFDWADIDAKGSSAPSRLTEHREWAVGVNYWLVPNHAVMKLAYHNVSGNLFAHDQEPVEEGETPDRHTDLVTVGMQSSY